MDIRPRDPVTVLGYTLKYIGKAPDIYRVDGGQGPKRYCGPAERWRREEAYNEALKGIRMVQPFGTMYGKLKAEKPVLTCEVCGGVEWISEWGLQRMLEHAVDVGLCTNEPRAGPELYAAL